jgi:GAG-pre-integrase domain
MAEVNIPRTYKPLLNILADTPRTKFHKEDSFNLIVDTGCTTSSTGFKEDFIPGSLRAIKSTITGISGKLNITHIGTVRYEVLDDKCNVKVIQTRAFLVPNLNSRLFGPQAYLIEMRRNKKDLYGLFNLHMTADAITMTWPDNSVLTITYDARNLMPRIWAYHDASQALQKLAQVGCVTSETNANLSQGQKDLLKWHFKLGHIDFKWVQWLNASNMLGTTSIPKTKIPAIKCEACQFGQQHRTPTGHTHVKNNPKEALKKAVAAPGDRVLWTVTSVAYQDEHLAVAAQTLDFDILVARSLPTLQQDTSSFPIRWDRRLQRHWKVRCDSNARHVHVESQ